MFNDLSLFFVLIILSAIFSASEVAFVSLSEAKVYSLNNKNRLNKAISNLKKNPQSLLITILIGNNAVNIYASLVAGEFSRIHYGSTTIGITGAILTFIILLFGEIIPKSYAQNHALVLAKICAFPLLILRSILFPLIWVFEFFIHGLLKLTGQQKLASITPEEVLAMVKIGKEEGTIEAHEQKFITNILEFSETQVDEVMTPRPKMITINANSSINEAIKLFIKCPHSRLPVYEENVDNIIGILTVQNALKDNQENAPETPLKNLKLIKPLFVPQSKQIKSLFNDFTKKHTHLAIIVDELGAILGLVTLEDLLEEIVGDIRDEQDMPNTMIEQLNDRTYLVDGQTPLEEIQEFIHIQFDNDCPEHKSISFLILQKLERFPKKKEKIKFDKFIIVVEKMAKNRIEQVRIILLDKNS